MPEWVLGLNGVESAAACPKPKSAGLTKHCSPVRVRPEAGVVFRSFLPSHRTQPQPHPAGCVFGRLQFEPDR